MTGGSERGNFVSEWFGYRTYPRVGGGDAAIRIQKSGRCPFLSSAIHEERDCVKSTSSSGVCTINNASNGTRQDWLVCPYRALDPALLEDVVRRLFGATVSQPVRAAPAPTLTRAVTREEILEQVGNRELVVVYLQNKLGGEISVNATDRSPEMSFDTTFVELAPAGDGGVGLGRFGVLEVQTMDFHGSYRQAVQNLNDSLRLHGPGFAGVLRENARWLSERIEGPNIANVFKRTFYQMMLKFQLGVHPRSVGTSLAVPQAVWDSWQPHLGLPDLVSCGDGTHALHHPDVTDAGASAWIHVFDVDAQSAAHPNPIVVRQTIITSAASIARYALEDAPNQAFSEDGSGGAVVAAIHRRLSAWWPELAA